jgi:hypothetical protein
MFSSMVPRGRSGRRRRRLIAVLGAMLVLGVVLLDAHADLPEHHHEHGTETVCVASLALATIAVAAWSLSLRSGRAQLLPPIPRFRLPRSTEHRPRMRFAARAGPSPPLVLRR